jgi:hypothetical protein
MEYCGSRAFTSLIKGLQPGTPMSNRLIAAVCLLRATIMMRHACAQPEQRSGAASASSPLVYNYIKPCQSSM